MCPMLPQQKSATELVGREALGLCFQALFHGREQKETSSSLAAPKFTVCAVQLEAAGVEGAEEETEGREEESVAGRFG